MRRQLLQISIFAVFILPSFVTHGQIKFAIGHDTCKIDLCSDNVIRIDYRPDGKFSERTPVIDLSRKWDKVNAKIKDRNNSVSISSPKFNAVINKNNFSVVITDLKGNVIISQNTRPHKSLAFAHSNNDNFYGLTGYNRDVNKGIKGITRNLGGVIHAEPQGGCGGPFIWSTSGYGILLDTDGGDITNKNGVLSFNNCSKENFEYYIIVGNPKEIIRSAGLIAGMPQMFPKWNCGFGQLEWGITEDEFKTHVSGYRERNIPFDWFMLDFDWMDWGEDNYGEFRWGPKFPNGANGGLKKWSENNGVKITGITKPRITAKNSDGTFTAQGKYAEEHGFWFPGEDFFNDYFSGKPSKDLQFNIQECRQWWWEHLRKGGFDKGIVGFLNDECDDSNVGGLYSLGNLSNLYMQQSIYEGQRGHSDKRVWSVNRTGYLGSQRYAYSIWSGDNYPNFEDLQSQPAKMLTANNVLMPIWGFCATAFWNPNPVTPEFYIRSMQTAFFAPLFFIHGTLNQQKQPWFFGEDVVKATRDIVNLRYKLIPYIYSYDRVKHEHMLGLSRALVIDYPNDPNVADMSETFMFGDYILASPVLESGISYKHIYMPDGTWIDYTNGKIYEGGDKYKYNIDNKTFCDIPMFIKKGAIIPSQEVTNYVGEKPIQQLNLDIFPSQTKTSFPFYEDDGETYDYEKGVYFKQMIELCDHENYVEIVFAKPEGVHVPSYKSYLINVHYRAAEDIVVSNVKLKRFENYAQMIESSEYGFCVSKDKYGVVTQIKTSTPLSETIFKVIGQEKIK